MIKNAAFFFGAMVLTLAVCTGCSSGSSTSQAADALSRYASVTHTPVPAVADAQENCGYVNTPTSRRDGILVIHAGATDCAEARSIVVHYLALPPHRLAGSAAGAGIDGWHCLSPTATTTAVVGYFAQCVRGTDDIRMVAAAR